MLELTKENFEAEVLKSEQTVIVDFWASWCGPCKMVAPTFEALSKELTDIKFGKINIDDQAELAEKFSVMTIPTFMLFKKGVAVDKIIGAMPKEALADFAKK